MITVLNFIAFWTVQFKYSCNKLFPWPVTSPFLTVLTVSAGQCCGWGARASAFMLTVSVVTNVPSNDLFTDTSARPRTVTEVNTAMFRLMEAIPLLNTMHGPAVKSSIGSLTTEATLTGLATGVLIVINKAVVASATTPMFDLRTRSITKFTIALLSLITEATLTGSAIYFYKVAATAPQLITEVRLNTAEAITASVTKHTLDPLTDAKPGLLTALMLTYVSTETALTKAALTFVNRARPSVKNILVSLIKSLNTEVEVKFHAAAAVNCSATSAAATNQAALLTNNY